MKTTVILTINKKSEMEAQSYCNHVWKIKFSFGVACEKKSGR